MLPPTKNFTSVVLVPRCATDVREEVSNELFWRRERVWLFVIAIVAVISFGGLVVVTNQALSVSSIIQVVPEQVPRATHRRRHEPKLHFRDGSIIEPALPVQDEGSPHHMTNIVIALL